MTPTADSLAALLAKLCLRAGCEPGDGSPGAGLKVRARVAHELPPMCGEDDLFPCLFAVWVRLATGCEKAVVTTDSLFVPLPHQERRPGVVGVKVPLPNAVRESVRQIDGRPVPYGASAEEFACPQCGGRRRIIVECDSQRRRAARCLCRACSRANRAAKGAA